MDDDMLPLGTTVHIDPEDIKWECNGGDLISREALKKILGDPLYRSSIKDYGEILKYTFVMDIIDNAQAVSDRYNEGYAQGYIDGSTGADWRGEEE